MHQYKRTQLKHVGEITTLGDACREWGQLVKGTFLAGADDESDKLYGSLHMMNDQMLVFPEFSPVFGKNVDEELAIENAKQRLYSGANPNHRKESSSTLLEHANTQKMAENG